MMYHELIRYAAVYFYVVMSLASCATSQSDIFFIEDTSYPMLKIINTDTASNRKSKHDLDCKNLLPSKNVKDVYLNCSIVEQNLLYNKYLIIMVKNETTDEQVDYISYMFNYNNGKMITGNDLNLLRPLVQDLLILSVNEKLKFKVFGNEMLGIVLSTLFFHHTKIIFDNPYNSQLNPKITHPNDDTTVFEYYFYDYISVFSSEITYCKLTITPDKIKFESHNIKPDDRIFNVHDNTSEDLK